MIEKNKQRRKEKINFYNYLKKNKNWRMPTAIHERHGFYSFSILHITYGSLWPIITYLYLGQAAAATGI